MKNFQKNNNTIGIDLGIKGTLFKDFATTSDAEIKELRSIENPKFLKKSLKKLKFLQRQYAKIRFKSRIKTTRRLKELRLKELRLKVASCHEKISNRRKDFLHKVSSSTVYENQVICFEDLNIKGTSF